MLNSQIFLFLFIITILLLSAKNIEHFVITRPSKCFDCEKHIIKTSNIWNVWKALPTKCFDCEKQSDKPYITGPSKCFDCDFFKLNKDSCKK